MNRSAPLVKIIIFNCFFFRFNFIQKLASNFNIGYFGCYEPATLLRLLLPPPTSIHPYIFSSPSFVVYCQPSALSPSSPPRLIALIDACITRHNIVAYPKIAVGMILLRCQLFTHIQHSSARIVLRHHAVRHIVIE